MINALLTFTPMEPYFFGSELTHGDGGANYFAVSNRLPQQSTLCGVLRHLLYLAWGDAGRGLHSFHPEDVALNDHGYLQSLSPLFLCRRTGETMHYYLRQALDRHTGGVPFVPTPTTHTEVLSPYQTGWQPAFTWEGLDAKKSLADAWVRSDGQETVRAEDIFLERTRPGITKKADDTRRKREKGFYKQLAYQLKDRWSFGVIVQFDDQVVVTDLDDVSIPMGGEKTVFVVKAAAFEQSFEQLFATEALYHPAGTRAERLVLLSDTYVPDTALSYISGGITESVDFRHLQTHAQVRNFGPLQRREPVAAGQVVTEVRDKMTKSTKYTLLARGSVLVAPNANALAALQTELDIAPWRTIGFNHFFPFQQSNSTTHG